MTVQPGFGFVVALAVIVTTLVWSLLRREEQPRTGAADRDASLRRALRRPDLLIAGHTVMRARRLPRLEI